ncbi:pyridoxamine 5'-phosphate oxidase family protein [Micromonospora terminaliae]|uniref:Pyridoxamine 5'-phosphate oxidase family protein n=1 Tax=Micromonospora terminaliae TaxID=1914461 RepID=A0AAJ2ZGS1_9ACTN|nr:pyridoxamine 5'-phosphate oxidase family protein [Micromonospora terminaliae]NES29815.1 pyridoxamine 5'-phosphate oxidase family protein [Micromonospora terminaliae]QGL50000.1 pyridoxamine 5'-phosphate oxidase family protein [Micromonospora terminaliae]
MVAPPRSRAQRWKDTLDRLDRDVDVWVATADPADCTPYLVPLSFLWDGKTLLLSTAVASPTGRNLLATGRVRLGVGETRDVVLVEGTVETLRAEELPDGVGDAFAAKTGFDPRRLGDRYRYFRVRPRLVQAWREENELAGRDLMRDGDRITE